MKKIALHWWILIGMGLGVVYGIIAAQTGYTDHVVFGIKRRAERGVAVRDPSLTSRK